MVRIIATYAPAYADGQLFSIGMTGVISAYDAKTGKELWRQTQPAIAGNRLFVKDVSMLTLWTIP
jgi:outer membrane protein assembly factor BamB